MDESEKYFFSFLSDLLSNGFILISNVPFQLRPLTARKEFGNLSTSNGLSGGYMFIRWN